MRFKRERNFGQIFDIAGFESGNYRLNVKAYFGTNY